MISHCHHHISSPSAQQKLDIIYLSQTPTIHPFPFVICISRSEDGWRSGIDSPNQLHQASHFEAHEPKRSYDFPFPARRSYSNIGPWAFLYDLFHHSVGMYIYTLFIFLLACVFCGDLLLVEDYGRLDTNGPWTTLMDWTFDYRQ